jgi:flavoprotein
MPERLKYTEIKATRLNYINQQNNLCKLCEQPLDNPCLDHCHKTGNIRKVLCRGCNVILSKVENNMVRNRITQEKLKVILTNMYDYLYDDYTSNPIHPTHNKKRRK